MLRTHGRHNKAVMKNCHTMHTVLLTPPMRERRQSQTIRCCIMIYTVFVLMVLCSPTNLTVNTIFLHIAICLAWANE